MKFRLMTPGPSPVPEETLLELARPVPYHRTPEMRQLLGEITQDLQYVSQTTHPVLTLTSSGTGGMEAAVVNCVPPGGKVICLIAGRFGDLILTACGLSLLTSFFFGLESVRRLAFFMKNVSLSNQPITLGWFIIGGTVLRMVSALIFLFMLKVYQGVPIGLFTAALLGVPIYCSWALFFFILRSILELITVMNKLRAEIDQYIRYG